MTASFPRFTSSNHHPASNKLEAFVVISWLSPPPNMALCMMTKQLYLILVNPNNIIPQLLLLVQNLWAISDLTMDWISWDAHSWKNCLKGSIFVNSPSDCKTVTFKLFKDGLITLPRLLSNNNKFSALKWYKRKAFSLTLENRKFVSWWLYKCRNGLQACK